MTAERDKSGVERTRRIRRRRIRRPAGSFQLSKTAFRRRRNERLCRRRTTASVGGGGENTADAERQRRRRTVDRCQPVAVDRVSVAVDRFTPVAVDRMTVAVERNILSVWRSPVASRRLRSSVRPFSHKFVFCHRRPRTVRCVFTCSVSYNVAKIAYSNAKTTQVLLKRTTEKKMISRNSDIN